MVSGSLPLDLDERLRRFLAEDVGRGDMTAETVVPPGAPARATLKAKSAGVIAGADLVARLVALVDPAARVDGALRDGERVQPGSTVATLHGDARALLAVERTLLNLVQRMSGIATLTSRFVAAIAGTGAVILDTRKTAPGLRFFDKRAVAAGGGVNHRQGLWDEVLIKSNHLVFTRAAEGQRPIEPAIRAARAGAPAGTRLVVEVFDEAEAMRAAQAGADVVMFDNFGPPRVAEAVRRVRASFGRERVLLEASGGVDLTTVRAFAEAGVDRISVGALTHSAPALDLSLVFTLPEAGG
jgi:nicotinate-nucleotide pyrophosphorylase (carboxylating)